MALPKAGVEMVAESMAPFLRDMGKGTDAVADFGKQGSKSGSLFSKGFGEVVTGALRKVGEMGVDALVDAGKSVVGFVKDSIDVAGDFEAGMNDMAIAVGKSLDGTGVSLQDFHDDFIQIGKDLPVSTSDVQQAAIELIKGGVDPLTLHMGALKDSVQFATAADLDQAKAAELSARQLGVWTDATATATQQNDFLIKSHDLLVRAANASTVGVADLAAGENVAGGIAKALNLDYRDFTVTMAELAPAFNSTEEAGTSYKNFLARLQPSTKPAKEAMMDLGLWTKATGSAFFDATGKYIGNRAAAELLKKATEGLTDAQRAATLQQIFGNDAMGAAVRLATDGAAGYDVMSDKINKASGVTEAAAEKQKGFNTAMENAKGSIEALQIIIAEKLLPVLSEFLNTYITPLINQVSAFVETMFKLGPAIVASNDPLQTFLNALKVAAPGLLPLISGVENLADAIKPLIIDVASLVRVIGDLTSLLPSTTSKIDETTNHTNELTFAVRSLTTVLGVSAVLSVGKWVAGLVAGLGPTIVIAGAIALLGGALGKLNEQFLGAGPGWVKFWEQQLPAALEKTRSDFNWMVIDIRSGLAGIDNWLAEQGLKFRAFWGADLPNAWENTKRSFKASITDPLNDWWQWVKFNFLVTLHDVSTWFGDTITSALGRLRSTYVDPLVTAWGHVEDAINSVWNMGKRFVDWLGSVKLPWWLTPGSPTPLETGLRGIADALQDAAVPGMHAFKDAISRIGAVIEGSDLPELAMAWGQDVMEGFAQGIKKATKVVVTYIDNAAKTVEDAFKDGFKIGSPSKLMADEVGFPLVMGILDGMQAAWPQLLAGLGELSDDLVDQATQAAEAIQSAVASAFGATADINRQKAKNLGDLQKLAGATRQQAEFQLKTAEELASNMSDPEQAKAFYALRSKQIFELAQLQSQLDKDLTNEQRQNLETTLKQYQMQIDRDLTDTQREAAQKKIVSLQDALAKGGLSPEAMADTMKQISDLQAQLAGDLTDEQRAGIEKAMKAINDQFASDLTDAQKKTLAEQVALIQKAQQLEQQELVAKTAGQSGADKLIEALRALLQGGFPVNDTGIGADLMALLAQLEGYKPPASPGQQYPGPTAAPTYNYNYSMPVTTNMTPSAIQQSWAIMGAAMP